MRTLQSTSGHHGFLASGLLLAGAAAIAAGCGQVDDSWADEPVETTQDAIVNGSPVPAGTRNEVGQVFTSIGWCTATLITPSHFLTADHCHNFAGISRGGSLALNGSSFTVDRLFSLGNRLLGQHDLAVGQIVGSVPTSVATPATIGDAAPGYDTTITQIGFGCNDRMTQAGKGVKRFLTFTRNSNNDVLCRGDSGGPGFLGNLNSNGAMVLVASGVYGEPWPFGNSNDLYADPGMHKTEINALTNALGNTGICYRVHAADVGWMPPVCNGTMLTNRNRTVYGVQIWSARTNVVVCYSAYLSNIGWQGEQCDSNLAGVLGQADKGMQALKIRLASRPGGETLTYQGFVGGVGFTPVVGENQVIGTPGSGRRLEAFSVTMTP